MGLIEAKDLVFEYIRRDEEGNVEGITCALDHINLDIKRGNFVAILGHNGSGKSTFAKHINAILYPTEGTVWVDGKDTSKEENLWDVRQEAGMVFQNPDNQIIGQVVEEDVGFGPENLGRADPQIFQRHIRRHNLSLIPARHFLPKACQPCAVSDNPVVKTGRMGIPVILPCPVQSLHSHGNIDKPKHCNVVPAPFDQPPQPVIVFA